MKAKIAADDRTDIGTGETQHRTTMNDSQMAMLNDTHKFGKREERKSNDNISQYFAQNTDTGFYGDQIDENLDEEAGPP